MNKDELLKIYSAYLPYGLKVQLSVNDSYPNKITKLSGIMDFGLLFLGSGGRFGFTERNLEDVKPILYDLSYLTKDEFNFIWENEVDTDSLEQAISLDSESFLTCKFSYSFWTELFKNHFNVFGLPESEYINKATLTTNK